MKYVYMYECAHENAHTHAHTHTHTHAHTHCNMYCYIALPYKVIIKLCGMMQLPVIVKPWTIAIIYCITLNSVCVVVKACLLPLDLPEVPDYPVQSPLENL